MMKKSIFILIITSIFFGFTAYSQNNPRMENPDYAVTVFDDDFDGGNWRDNWILSPGGYGTPNLGVILIWVDSIATIQQDFGNLYLTGLKSENYSGTGDDGPIIADYISGEVRSKDRFLYGVFECNATFGYKKGSFPAFWLFFDTVCEYDYGSEIDIVELKYEAPNPGLDNHAYYYPCDSNPSDPIPEVPGSWKDNEFDWSTGMAHTFKCIWTPTKTEWYVDNSLLHTIYNTGNNHYPNKTMDIRLSQQLYPYKNKLKKIDVPVKSTFHWVKAKEFFLAPEITCSECICISDTASMDVDSDAYDITWSLSPSSLFTGSTSGAGKTASINIANMTGGAKGKITYTFKMPLNNGTFETFTAEKSFWVRGPAPSNVSLAIMDNLTGQQVELYNMCPNTTYVLECINSSSCSTSNYSWTLPYGMSQISASSNWVLINTNSSPGGILMVHSATCCTSCGSNVLIHTENLSTDGYDCDNYYMMISPNPSNGEVTISILSKNGGDEVKSDFTASWDVHVVSVDKRVEVVKESKLKGNKYKLNTSGWKQGVYVVQAKYNDKIVEGKLMVK